MITILCVVLLFLCVVGLVMAAMKRENGMITWFKVLAALVVLASVHSYGQSNCDKVVADTANMLNGRSAQVEQAAGPLINQGADVHVVTVNDSHGNIDFVENDIEKSCPSWRNPQGVRKSTLIAMVVSKDRKLGVYYGSAWHSALDNHWNRIKTDYMVPRFRDGDYAAGFIAAEEQLAKRLAAAKDESLKPAVTQNQVVNQASDYSGLWKFLSWLLVLGGMAFCVALIISVRRKREKYQIDLLAAQQGAQVASNLAAQDIGRLEDSISTKEALGETVSFTAKSLLDQASQSYSRLNNSVSGSPNTEGLDISSYNVMKEQYERISLIVSKAFSAIDGVAKNANTEIKPSNPSGESKPSGQSTHSHHSKRSTASVASEPQSPEPVQQPYVPPVSPYTPSSSSSTNVVIVDNNNNYSRRDEDDYRPTRHSEPEPSSPSSSGGFFGSSSSSSSSDSDSGGGGSSSWSSSDSSSSSDSGSSSSFGDSSDSGGGGSSDF